MRVGVVILPQFRWPEARPGPGGCRLEQRGFAHGWTYDHLAWRDLADEPWYATIPTLVAAAHRDEHLRLGTWGRLRQLPAPGDDGQVGRARPRPVTEPSPSRRR